MVNTTDNQNHSELPAKMTISEICQLVGYKSTITTYQMLRHYKVKSVSARPQPGGRAGRPMAEYDTTEVLRVFRDRLSRMRQKQRTEIS